MGRTNSETRKRGIGVVQQVRETGNRSEHVDGRRTKPPAVKTEQCKGCGFTIAHGAGYCGECLCEEDGI